MDLEVARLVSAPMTTLCRWDCDKNEYGLFAIFELVGPSKHIAHNNAQEAIKQLRERGEKVTAFVVIAVAKQVVLFNFGSLIYLKY